MAAEKTSDLRGAYHAIKLMHECIRKDPDNVRYYLLLGNLYGKIGDEQKKVQAWQRAYLLDPENPEAQRRMRELDKRARPPVTRAFSPSPIRSAVISAILIFIGALIMNLLDYVVPARDEQVNVAEIGINENRPPLETLYPDITGPGGASTNNENDNAVSEDVTEPDAADVPDETEAVAPPEENNTPEETGANDSGIPDDLVELIDQMDKRGVCFAGGIGIRSGPGLDYDELAKADEGDILRITGIEGRWFKVLMADGTPGYISRTYVNLRRSKEDMATYGVLWVGENKAEHAVVFRKPEVSSDIIDLMEPGKQVFVMKEEGDWLTILMPDDRLAYILNKSIEK